MSELRTEGRPFGARAVAKRDGSVGALAGGSTALLVLGAAPAARRPRAGLQSTDICHPRPHPRSRARSRSPGGVHEPPRHGHGAWAAAASMRGLQRARWAAEPWALLLRPTPRAAGGAEQAAAPARLVDRTLLRGHRTRMPRSGVSNGRAIEVDKRLP